jgi:hypothetical protein
VVVCPPFRKHSWGKETRESPIDSRTRTLRHPHELVDWSSYELVDLRLSRPYTKINIDQLSFVHLRSSTRQLVAGSLKLADLMQNGRLVTRSIQVRTSSSTHEVSLQYLSTMANRGFVKAKALLRCSIRHDDDESYPRKIVAVKGMMTIVDSVDNYHPISESDLKSW